MGNFFKMFCIKWNTVYDGKFTRSELKALTSATSCINLDEILTLILYLEFRIVFLRNPETHQNWVLDYLLVLVYTICKSHDLFYQEQYSIIYCWKKCL